MTRASSEPTPARDDSSTVPAGSQRRPQPTRGVCDPAGSGAERNPDTPRRALVAHRAEAQPGIARRGHLRGSPARAKRDSLCARIVARMLTTIPIEFRLAQRADGNGSVVLRARRREDRDVLDTFVGELRIVATHGFISGIPASLQPALRAGRHNGRRRAQALLPAPPRGSSPVVVHARDVQGLNPVRHDGGGAMSRRASRRSPADAVAFARRRGTGSPSGPRPRGRARGGFCWCRPRRMSRCRATTPARGCSRAARRGLDSRLRAAARGVERRHAADGRRTTPRPTSGRSSTRRPLSERSSSAVDGGATAITFAATAPERSPARPGRLLRPRRVRRREPARAATRAAARVRAARYAEGRVAMPRWPPRSPERRRRPLSPPGRPTRAPRWP